MPDQPPPASDYIQDYMTARPANLATSALVIVDMQYASGHRKGALGRRMHNERSNLTDYRFDRIEQLVIPNILHMAPVLRTCGGEVIYITQGAERPDCADAPPHMCKFYAATGNYRGSREHEILDERAPEPSLAYLLSRMSHPAFPEPRGVFRCIDAPVYEQQLVAQIDEATQAAGPGDLHALFHSG